MITAIDTNILLDILVPNELFTKRRRMLFRNRPPALW